MTGIIPSNPVELFDRIRQGFEEMKKLAPEIATILDKVENDLINLGEILGLELDMEARNMREIEATVATFIVGRFAANSERARTLAHSLLTMPALGISTSPDEDDLTKMVRKDILSIEVQYKLVDSGTWQRTVLVWHQREGKPVRYTAETALPRDELPPEVRKQSLASGRSEFILPIYPFER